MNFLKSNLIVILLFYIVAPIIHIFLDFDGIYLMMIITVWMLTVVFHELGHCFIALLRGMRISFISGLPGMYMNGRWYLRIPMYFSFGAMLAYKPLRKGHITKKDIIWLNLGGALFNLIAIIILLMLKYIVDIENSVLNFALLTNVLIGLVTGLNPAAADGKSIWNLIKGNTDELKYYDSMDYMYDPEVSHTRILNEIEENRDIIANYSRNIAWIEQNVDSDNITGIYNTELHDTEELNRKLAKAFQNLYKAVDKNSLTEEEIEIFNEVNTSLYFVFGDIYRYFKTKDPMILMKLEEYNSWMPSQREDMLFKNALKKLVV